MEPHPLIMSTPRVDGAEERKTFDRCACGKRKETADYVCAECFRAPHRVRPVRESKSQNAKRVTVIFCPGNEFDRGARFLAREFGLVPDHSHGVTTLTLGHWTPLMIVEDWLGRRWQVSEGDPQYMTMVLPKGD